MPASSPFPPVLSPSPHHTRKPHGCSIHLHKGCVGAAHEPSGKSYGVPLQFHQERPPFDHHTNSTLRYSFVKGYTTASVLDFSSGTPCCTVEVLNNRMIVMPRDPSGKSMRCLSSAVLRPKCRSTSLTGRSLTT